MLPRILEIRHELAGLRRVIAPMRDALANLYGDDVEFVGDEVRVYLRDCYDHTLQLIDVIETYREVAGGLLEVYVSAMSQRTNEVMRVLTIFSTIFMPLTFIVGIYGMNFQHRKLALEHAGARVVLRLPVLARVDGRHYPDLALLLQEEKMARPQPAPASARPVTTARAAAPAAVVGAQGPTTKRGLSA